MMLTTTIQRTSNQHRYTNIKSVRHLPIRKPHLQPIPYVKKLLKPLTKVKDSEDLHSNLYFFKPNVSCTFADMMFKI